MFLWCILKTELVPNFLSAQQMNPVKNDLCLQFDSDLKQCGIALTMSEIANMKKVKFRNIVNTQLRIVAREYLLTLKAKHSKLDYLPNRVC